MINDRKQGVLI